MRRLIGTMSVSAAVVNQVRRRLDMATEQSTSAVTAAINAAASFSQADLDSYVVSTLAVGLPAREFWNPRQADVYAALRTRLENVDASL